MTEDTPALTIDDLAERAGVPVRTVRFYIAEGLLPGPGARGKAATYGDEHLTRLLLIRRLAEQRVPLAEQRERLARLSPAEIRSLLAEEERRSAELQRVREAPSPKEYVSALLSRARAARPHSVSSSRPMARLAESAPAGPVPPQPAGGSAVPESTPAGPPQAWRRWELAPGVELHVRSDAEQRHHPLIVRLLQVAGASENLPAAGEPDNLSPRRSEHGNHGNQ